MSSLYNISFWESIKFKNLINCFSKEEIKDIKNNGVTICYDPLEEDFIAQFNGVPVLYANNLSELRNKILNKLSSAA